MNRFATGLLVLAGAFLVTGEQAAPPARVAIDYPADGSVFPPGFPAPTFLWKDVTAGVQEWRIDVESAGGTATRRVAAPGWTPDAETWAAIQRNSVDRPAVVSITGLRGAVVSRGQVAIRTSEDPVGAPIFYRDVPLMPSELEKGVIKPLATAALPLIAWRLRDVREPRSRLLMEGLHTCANCHSFSGDGKTLGMDLDGPRSDKGMYAIVPVVPRTSIRSEDVVTWGSVRDRPGSPMRVGFMSQVSPDGKVVVTTVKAEYYVANFMDYRFLQVFYPTRGILAWFSRATGRMQSLPGADDASYVHTNAVWSPDGQYLVFARAEARDAYPPGRKPAGQANDPNETPIQYDLCRIPFDEGRGGSAELIAGASRNGMSNSFPKVSPDGRWIVFVQARNGQLMRPDSQLYIVPSAGGTARKMRCNTPLMNSWHSFSPNGRWMVFSSKSRSPYTQMFLTHLDEDGNDSPAILIENATAADRAVNIPEFVNIPPGGLVKIDAPAAEFYRLFDSAWVLGDQGRYEEAIAEWNRALKFSPGDSRALYNLGAAHANFGVALSREKRVDEAIVHFGKALEVNPASAEVHINLGVALVWKGQANTAIVHFGKALKIDPESVEAQRNLGDAHYYLRGNPRQAVEHWRAALVRAPDDAALLNHVAWVLATSPEAALRNGVEAVKLAQRAERLTGGRDAAVLDTLAAAYAETGRFWEAVQAARRAAALKTGASTLNTPFSSNPVER
ncbi:MAG: tetratricopeptide repeat protein [Acidobacteria bacterium]|nr:tetratricopeptide repeat protein [Acidobacteriota bacterium]